MTKCKKTKMNKKHLFVLFSIIIYTVCAFCRKNKIVFRIKHFLTYNMICFIIEMFWYLNT